MYFNSGWRLSCLGAPRNRKVLVQSSERSIYKAKNLQVAAFIATALDAMRAEVRCVY